MKRPLPIDESLPELLAALRQSRRAALVAPPGAGKTTRVPPAILADRLLSRERPNLVMLQPRRVAARASAQRIADENGWTLGQEVGYQIRQERRIGPATRIRVLTEGILTRQLLADPFLEGIGAVILDEFHERSLEADLCLALLREVRETVREDLVLLVMSATMDAGPVARFLGDCPIVNAPGRSFPVQIDYAGAGDDSLSDRAADVVLDVLSGRAGADDPGDLLVFLPGAEEIRRTGVRLESFAASAGLRVLPLHGRLTSDEQAAALRPADRRKVVLATNVAETSLTIDGVRTVIDAGYARVASYDPQRGLDRLDLRRISKASADQRAGRAGRTAPGRCLRLWSLAEQRNLDEHDAPEIARVDLCAAVLALLAWGKPDPRSFAWYEAPPERALLAAERLLAMLGALDAESGGAMTPLGRRLLDFPAHPRLARLLLAADADGAAVQGAAIAALLSERDVAYPNRGNDRSVRERGPSDLLVRLGQLDRAEQARFSPSLRDEGIDPAAARQAAATRDELLRRLGRRRPPASGAIDPASESTILELAMLAYPDRVCRRRSTDPSSAAMVGGGGVRLASESVVRDAEFFLALDPRFDPHSARREAIVRVASAIEPGWLEARFPEQIRRRRLAVFDEARGKVVGRNETWYRDLLIRADDNAPVDPADASAALSTHVAPSARDWFARDKAAANLLARVALLRQWMPERDWPALNDAELASLLAEACAGKRGLDELARVPLAPLLAGRLPYPLDRLLDEQAPIALTVPSGSRIALDYTAGPTPVLAVRLQEIFGLTETPRLAAGRAPVLLHLLGPNFRPVQITSDLRSFWATTYFQVRKELRIRYPKHAWPDDPLAAKPEAKGRHRPR